MLRPTQLLALNALKQRRNVILTGKKACGKSAVLDQFVSEIGMVEHVYELAQSLNGSLLNTNVAVSAFPVPKRMVYLSQDILGPHCLYYIDGILRSKYDSTSPFGGIQLAVAMHADYTHLNLDRAKLGDVDVFCLTESNELKPNGSNEEKVKK